MNAKKLWLSVREAAPLVGRTPKQVYDLIRLGSFPFAYRRSRGNSGAIFISARDLGLIPEQGATNSEAQEQDQRLATAA